MRDVTRAKIPSLCGAIWRTILNFYASQGVWVNCYRIHQKSLNFVYPFKFYSNFTNKNVSWLTLVGPPSISNSITCMLYTLSIQLIGPPDRWSHCTCVRINNIMINGMITTDNLTVYRGSPVSWSPLSTSPEANCGYRISLQVRVQRSHSNVSRTNKTYGTLQIGKKSTVYS